jgi:hypothetical protein
VNRLTTSILGPSQLNPNSIPDLSQLNPNFTHSLPLFPLTAIFLFNFSLSLILCLYFLLRWAFFGYSVNLVPVERQQILEKLFMFFSFKFVLIGLVVEPAITDMIAWVFWCAMLAVAKALLHHGLVCAQTIAGSAAGLRAYARPALHFLFVWGYASGMCFVFRLWVIGGSNPPAFWLLFLFDIVTLAVEVLQSMVVYSIFASSAAGWKVFLDPPEHVSTVNLLADIALLLITLLHFCHVCFVNGLMLSLVDVLLFINIRSTCLQVSDSFLPLK